MKIIKCLFASALLIFTSSLLAEEQSDITNLSSEELTSAYISDDLFIYMLAGSGKNYRILGTIIAGDEIQLTGKVENGYTQIVDSKNRTTWVESQYINDTAGLRFVVAELNGKLATNEEANQQTLNQLDSANVEIEQLSQQTKQQNVELANLKQQLINTQSKLKNQDMDTKKEWLFIGAIVLAIGLILGLIIPRLPMRKKASMQNWK
jgi:SH3 domain protein